eukprot:2148680-Amphidinium_carterae.1
MCLFASLLGALRLRTADAHSPTRIVFENGGEHGSNYVIEPSPLVADCPRPARQLQRNKKRQPIPFKTKS